MLNLPSSDSPLRELFDIETDLVPVGMPGAPVATFREAVTSARRSMVADPRITAIHSICMTADDHIRLVKIGPRGGLYRLWDFGRRFR